MKLSVIVPGYNTPNAWWERCLKSVLAALPEGGEVVCVDDGSKMRPEVSVRDSRIKWIYLERNGGQAAARNRALEVAHGEYVTFVDSDDEVTADVYATCLAADNLTADIILFGVQVDWVVERLRKVDRVPFAGALGVLSESQLKELFDACLLEYPVNKLYRRAFLTEHGIRFPEGICPGEDSIFNLRCIKAKARWTAVDIVGYVYYRYSGSSLSRYLPTYGEAMKMKAALWREVYSGVMPDCTEAYREAMLWDNVWRKGSPYSFRARCAYAREHGQSVIKMIVKNLIKRFAYTRQLRRYKIKKVFPKVMEVK